MCPAGGDRAQGGSMSQEIWSAVDTYLFDFIFIDADKPSTPDYFTWSLRLSRPGTVIVVDNVIRKGAVTDASTNDANTLGIRRFNDVLKSTPGVSATSIQTVGSKGYDG